MLNNPKDVDPSYQTDLDFWDCFEMKKLRLITEEIGTCFFMETYETYPCFIPATRPYIGVGRGGSGPQKFESGANIPFGPPTPIIHPHFPSISV